MTRHQQNKIFNAMNDEQKSRVEAFLLIGYNRNTAISSVVMQDILASSASQIVVMYSQPIT